MQVEHVAGIGLAAGRAPEVEGELAVRPRLLGQVVVAAQDLFALLHEVLTHRAARVGCDEVQRRGVGGGGGDDDRVVHRAVFLERRRGTGDRRRVLPDRHIDADEVLALLVDDRVEENRRLSGEPVADDQLALAATDRDHRVDRLDAGLNRAVHALAGDDSGGDLLDRQGLGRLDRALAVERLSQRVDDAADQRLAHRHLEEAAGGAHLVALVQMPVVTEDDGADLVLLEVQREAVRLVRELEQLARHRILQAVDLRDSVTGRDDASHVRRHQAGVEILEPFLDDFGDLFGADSHFLR